MTLMTNKLKFPDGVTITATISPATEEILVPGYRTHSRTSSATTGGFGRRPNAGYKFQFITLAGFHALNYSMFQLARGYKESGMSAYAELQEAESALPRSIR